MNLRQEGDLRQNFSQEFTTQLSLQILPQQIDSVEDLSHQGGLNEVYRALTPEGNNVIIKLNQDVLAVRDFHKAAWCQDQARKKGIPTPKTLAIGTTESFAYMVQESLEGVPIMQLEGENLGTWEQVGRYAAHINTIPTTQFGREFHGNESHDTWEAYLQEELQPEKALAMYQNNGLLTPEQVKKASRIIEKMRAWNFSPTLAHNDLYRNTLVLPNGEVSGFIDWDQAISTLAPYGDIATTAPFLTPKQYDAFLKGYGINPYDFNLIQQYIEVSGLLLGAKTIESSIQAGNAQMLALAKRKIGSSSLVRSNEMVIYSAEEIDKKRFYFCGSTQFVLGRVHGDCSGRLASGEEITSEEYLSVHFKPKVENGETKSASSRREAISFIRKGAMDMLQIIDVLRENKELQSIDWIIGLTNPQMAKIAENIGFQRLERNNDERGKDEGLVAIAIKKEDLPRNEERIRKLLG